MRYSEGPFFDELKIGDIFDEAPGLTLTAGRAAEHQSILGSRLRVALDSHLSLSVANAELADPSFVWDVSIGQSTLVTRRVIANLFYRGLVFHRIPSIGDTLHTKTEVVGLRQTTTRPAGLAALRVTTRDQKDRLVLDYWRCAMLPLSSADIDTGQDSDLAMVGTDATKPDSAFEWLKHWNLETFPTTQVAENDSWNLESGDVVTSAPELARLTLNLARVHHDRFAGIGERLVYGGHAIGLAFAQLTKTLPNLVTVVGWESCDHIAPVREGDTLVSDIKVQRVQTIAKSLVALDLHIHTFAKRESDKEPVLDWKLIAIACV